MGIQERIKELEDAMRSWQYNKRTEKAFGVAKAQVAKLREKLQKNQAKKTKRAGFFVRKSGDATAVLLGFPSVGKSTLLNKLTSAQSKVSHYAFTTLDVIPGVLEHKGAKIQVLDVPGIITGAAAGKGRGKEVLAMARNSDLLIILIDATRPEHYNAIMKELFDTGVRVNQQPPDVKITKKSKGGLNVASTIPLDIEEETIKEVLKQFRINNADVLIRSKIDLDSLIDVIEGNRAYIPAITIITKADLVDENTKQHLIDEIRPDLFVSAEREQNISELKKLVFDKLSFIRVYTKEVGKKADLKEPMILKKGTTIADACARIHRDLVKKFRYARVWGPTAKFPGQTFRNLDKQLSDGDIIEIHTK